MSEGVCTIATHNGTAVCAEHNRRDPAYALHEPHIDPRGYHETWIDESVRQAYHRLFGEAVAEYNQGKQPCRQIADYYDQVVAERAEAEAYNEQVRRWNAEEERKAAEEGRKPRLKKPKAAAAPVYEMVVGVYPQDGLELDEEQSREMLRQWFVRFEDANPNIAIIGAYYHADEPDAQPHLHVDYIPVGQGYTRGPKRQNSMERAMQAQGMGSKGGTKGTAQMQFEAQANEILQEVVEGYGYEVDHPQRGRHSSHLSTPEKKRVTELERQGAELARREQDLDARQREIIQAEAAAAKRRKLEAQAARYSAKLLEAREAAIEGREAKAAEALIAAQEAKEAAQRVIREGQAIVADAERALVGWEQELTRREFEASRREQAQDARQLDQDRRERLIRHDESASRFGQLHHPERGHEFDHV